MITLYEYINILLQDNCDIKLNSKQMNSPDFMSYISIEINNKKNKPCVICLTNEEFKDEQKVVSAIDKIQLNTNVKLIDGLKENLERIHESRYKPKDTK